MFSFIWGPRGPASVVGAAALAGLLACAPCTRAASFGPGDIKMIDGGFPDSPFIAGYDINNAGIVTGAAIVQGTRPFLDPGFSGLVVDPLPPIDAHFNYPVKIAKNGNAVGGERYTQP